MNLLTDIFLYSDESLDVDPNYDPSDFLKLPGSRQDNHDMGMIKQELHQEMQQYDMQQEELQKHEYEHQEYQQQDYQQMDSVNIEVIDGDLRALCVAGC